MIRDVPKEPPVQKRSPVSSPSSGKVGRKQGGNDANGPIKPSLSKKRSKNIVRTPFQSARKNIGKKMLPTCRKPATQKIGIAQKL